MKKKQTIAILLSVLLLTSVTLPGTWAQEDTVGDVVNEAEPEATPAATDPVPEATPTATESDTDTDTDTESDTTPVEEIESDTESDTTPVEDTESETESETLPPETETETTPTTDTVIVEVEKEADPTLPAEEDITAANIAFVQIMDCVTLDDIWVIMDNMTDAQMRAFTLEQCDEIDALIAFLCMPLDDVNILIEDDEVIEEENDAPVESVVIYPTVDFVYAAPLGDPVIG